MMNLILWLIAFCVRSSRGFIPLQPTYGAQHNVFSVVRASGEIPRATTTLLSARRTAVSDEKATIQILMSDTGGGHRASANALRDAFDVLHPGKISVDIVDIYTDYGPFWPYNDYVALYKFMAKYPWTWDFFYHFGATPVGLFLNEFFLEKFCFDNFSKCLSRPFPDTNQRADMVVSVHPLCQDVPLKALAQLDSGSRDFKARTTPFCTVVTDLGSAHPTWFNPGVDKCFVPSDALNEVAQQRRLVSDQIVQYGLPIRKGFWSEQSKPTSSSSRKTVRKKLNLEPSLPTVLVVGGGDGMGGLVDIATELGNELGQAASTPQFQLVVVCGNNAAAKETLDNNSWGDGVEVSIEGFVDNMDEFMRASDALVTKAGPGTIAEASICGLPCMMFSFLPGQEAGNIPFVEESGFGCYSGNPPEIAQIVKSWLDDSEKLESMQKAAIDAARPQATLDIARDLAQILFAHKETQRSASEKLTKQTTG